MSIESENRYNYDEEEKKNNFLKFKKGKKRAEDGIAEFFVETSSITATAGGLSIGVENLAGNVSLPAGGLEKINSLDINKFESIRKTAEHGRIYDEGLLKADNFIKKDKEITEKKIKEIREQLEKRKKSK